MFRNKLSKHITYFWYKFYKLPCPLCIMFIFICLNYISALIVLHSSVIGWQNVLHYHYRSALAPTDLYNEVSCSIMNLYDYEFAASPSEIKRGDVKIILCTGISYRCKYVHYFKSNVDSNVSTQISVNVDSLGKTMLFYQI